MDEKTPGLGTPEIKPPEGEKATSQTETEATASGEFNVPEKIRPQEETSPQPEPPIAPPVEPEVSADDQSENPKEPQAPVKFNPKIIVEIPDSVSVASDQNRQIGAEEEPKT